MADHYRAQIPYESCALAKHWTKPGKLTEQARPCHVVMRRRGPGGFVFVPGRDGCSRWGSGLVPVVW